MKHYQIAGLNVCLHCFGKTVNKQATAYQADFDGSSDIDIQAKIQQPIIPIVPLSECTARCLPNGTTHYTTTQGDWKHTYRMEHFLKLHTKAHKLGTQFEYEFAGTIKEAPTLSINDLEYVYTGSAFANALIRFQGFVLHASAISLDGEAILFSAPSGTGKSTHTALWQTYFGDQRTFILNDDKPAIRWIDNQFYAYGTPWSGKYDISANRKLPLKAIVFLHQAPTNSIERLSSSQAVTALLSQILRSNSKTCMNALLTTLDQLLQQIPVYQMGCTISEDAVRTAYQTIYQEVTM